MKKVNERYVLSNTDRSRIEAHTRAIARRKRYDGEIQAWFDCITGIVEYHELVGQSYLVAETDNWEQIAWAPCRSWT